MIGVLLVASLCKSAPYGVERAVSCLWFAVCQQPIANSRQPIALLANQSPSNSPFLETLREQAPLSGSSAKREKYTEAEKERSALRSPPTFPPPSRGRSGGDCLANGF